MRAFRVHRPGPAAEGPLERVEVATPEPAPDELLVRVLACGVCRTDLHVAEGDLPVHRPHVVPGHEVVGRVVGVGDRVRGFAAGERSASRGCAAPAASAASAAAAPRTSARGSLYTGWDADGGYADHATVPADYALPAAGPGYTDARARAAAVRRASSATTRCGAPSSRPAGGSGSTASAAAPTSPRRSRSPQGATVHVMTRSPAARGSRSRLGVASAQDAADRPPEPLDAAILFAPVGDLVPPALAALDRGGTLAVAGIHLTDVPPLNYQRHLFQERHAAQRHGEHPGRRPRVPAPRRRAPPRGHAPSAYPLERADHALADLAADRVTGAAVLVP